MPFLHVLEQRLAAAQDDRLYDESDLRGGG